MTRSSFLKSLALFITTPSIVTDIKIKPKHKTKKCYTFVLSPEMYKDKKIMKFLLRKDGFIYENCKAFGINLDKNFSCQFGYVNDDFIYNRITGIITQYD